jgi:ATP-dependent protease ClpP protease subunit
MNSEQAKEYGLIDEILTRPDENRNGTGSLGQ